MKPARQVLPDRHVHGRQPPARARAAHACRRRSSAATRSTPATAPARAAARRSARAMPSTRRCARPANQLIAANATGCLEVFSTPYPEIVVAAAVDPLAVRQRRGGRHRHRRGAQGQGAEGRPGAQHVRVIAQGGDGGTTDIGFGCLSGMFERNDDVLYICYDNEAYMNTGVQRSSATPPAARTATTMAVGAQPGRRLRQGQERAADRDGARDPLRRHRDGRRPARPRGQGRARDGRARRALPAHPRALPARLGLGEPRHDQAGAAGARDRPLPGVRGRARRGDARDARSAAACRSRSTCGRRGASPTCSAARDIRRCWRGSRPRPTATSAASGCSTKRSRMTMHKPFAITLDLGSSLANKTGSWRTERPVYVDRLPPCNRAVSGRRGHPGLALPRRKRRLRGGLAPSHARQPVAGDHGARLLSPLRDGLQPRPARLTRSASTRSSGSSATRRSSRAGASPRPRRRRASAC